MSLADEVSKFKAWAARHAPPGRRGGEWELNCDGLDDLRRAAEAALADTPVAAWTGETIGDLLYAIARDNECELIIEAAARSPEQLLALADAALEKGEPDARWQIASRLGEATIGTAEVEARLLRFADDPDEYVSRMALLALGRLRSPHAEAVAERAWLSGREYQRIAALHVLKAVNSNLLARRLDEAIRDGREHLVMNARE